MKAAGWCAAAAAAIGIAFLILRGDPRDTEKPAPRSDSVASGATADMPEPETVVLPIATAAASLNSPETTAAEDIMTLGLVLEEFRKHHGGNPVGENDEITAALLGGNPKRLGYLRDGNASIGAGGVLIDRWGTPYFFHALSADRMEIISAGPDRKHHTGDDIASE